MSLEVLRAQLDEVDERLVRLLAERAGIVQEIWAWKAANGVARVDPQREKELRARLLGLASELGLSRERVSEILDRIVGQQLLQK